MLLGALSLGAYPTPTGANAAISVALALIYPGFYAPPPVVPTGAAPVFIATTVLPAPQVGTPYSVRLTALDGVPPYRYGLASGTLPPGLTLDPSGLLSGTAPALAAITPATLPNATVDVRYVQALTITRAPTATYAFTVTVVDAVAATDSQDFSVTLVSWQDPATYVLLSGKLPGCLGFGATGSIAGTPMTVGTFPLVVQATDQGGQITTRSFNFVVTS